MPYIKQKERETFEFALNYLIRDIKSNAQLTYVLYAICVKWFRVYPNALSSATWENRSDVLKCLHSAYHEFERKYIDDYEDLKINQDGDI